MASSAFAVCDPTLTVCESGCDYDSLDAAVTDLEANCATPSSPLSITISGSWTAADITPVTISGIATTADNDLTIVTTGDARHSGKWDDTAYVLEVSTSSSIKAFLSTNIQYITVDGLQVNLISDDSDFAVYGMHFDNDATKAYYADIMNNIIKLTVDGGSNTYTTGIDYDGLYSYVDIYNNIVYNFNIGSTNDLGIYVHGGTGAENNIHNNTVYNCSRGILPPNSVNTDVYNNIAIGNTGYDFSMGNASNDYNASSDATADGANALNSGSGTPPSTSDFVSVTGGSEDFHLSASAVEIDAGTDLGSPFDEDIDGESRTGTWDIGADEYSAGEEPAGTSSPIIKLQGDVTLKGLIQFNS